MPDEPTSTAGETPGAPPKEGVSTELQALKEDLKELRADLKALCQAAASGSRESVEALKARIAEAARHLKADLEEKARKEFAERPLRGLGIAFLVGFFLGAFFRRR